MSFAFQFLAALFAEPEAAAQPAQSTESAAFQDYAGRLVREAADRRGVKVTPVAPETSQAAQPAKPARKKGKLHLVKNPAKPPKVIILGGPAPEPVVEPEPSVIPEVAPEHQFTESLIHFEERYALIRDHALFLDEWGSEDNGYHGLIHHPICKVRPCTFEAWASTTPDRPDWLYLNFPVGHQFKTVDPFGNRVIVTSTRYGAVAVYEDTSAPMKFRVNGPIAALAAQGLDLDGLPSMCPVARMRAVLGTDSTPNIGELIEAL